MYCNGSVGVFTNVEEFLKNVVVRSGAIRVEEVIVTEATANETLSLVKLLVQTDNVGDVMKSTNKK